MAKRRINTQGNKARPDLVSVPFTEEEIATLRALQDELRESNVGPEQLAADAGRAGRSTSATTASQGTHSGTHGKAYAAVVSALARDEVDDLRRAMGVEGGDDPSPDPSLIKDVLDYGGELPSDMLTKRGAAVRWALRSGCEPADAPAFFKREGGITGCYQKWLKATPREPALNEAAARQDSAEGGHDRGPSAADAKPAKSAKEEAARSPRPLRPRTPVRPRSPESSAGADHRCGAADTPGAGEQGPGPRAARSAVFRRRPALRSHHQVTLAGRAEHRERRGGPSPRPARTSQPSPRPSRSRKPPARQGRRQPRTAARPRPPPTPRSRSASAAGRPRGTRGSGRKAGAGSTTWSAGSTRTAGSARTRSGVSASTSACACGGTVQVQRVSPVERAPFAVVAPPSLVLLARAAPLSAIAARRTASPSRPGAAAVEPAVPRNARSTSAKPAPPVGVGIGAGFAAPLLGLACATCALAR